MLRAASKPMSSRKKDNMPLNRSPAKGFIAASPASPLTMPTTIAPSSSSCAPSVSDSCITLPSGALCPGALSCWRTQLASSTARMMAGDSINAIAAAMCPP